jgi:predicted ester cyclase
MNEIDTVKSLFSALEAKDWKRAESYLADGFVLSGVTPMDVSAHDFIELHRHLLKAIPDWKFNIHDYKVSGDRVSAAARITGTHTEPLDLPMMDLHSIAATHKRIQMPEEPCVCVVRGDKVSRMEIKHVEGGGIDGVLKQLNIKLPHHESSR